MTDLKVWLIALALILCGMAYYIVFNLYSVIRELQETNIWLSIIAAKLCVYTPTPTVRAEVTTDD